MDRRRPPPRSLAPADRDPPATAWYLGMLLIAVGRIDLDDELGISSANGPGRSGNQVQVVIYPKRVKPYESFGPFLPWDGRVLQKILPGLFTLSINAVPLGLNCAKIFPKYTRTRGPIWNKKTLCVGFHASLD